MSDFPEKERYEGTFQGQAVRFNRTFRGKRLTDKQCEDLLAGKEIEIPGLKGKTGAEYGVTAVLDPDLEYNGHKYVGVKQTGFMKRGVPKTFNGKDLSDDERTMLESGHPVKVDGLVSKKTGKKYSATLTYDPDADRIEMSFDKN